MLFEKIIKKFSTIAVRVSLLAFLLLRNNLACIISNDKSYLDKQYSLVETLVLEYSELELLNIGREWL